MNADERRRASLLLGLEREAAFDEGLAPLLLCAFERPVASVLAADRAASYLNVLYALLLLRRAHDLQPLHEELYRRVHPAQLALGRPYDPEAYAQDLAQLEAWGCVERIVEALKIRGYRDNRREQFRYRLTEDAVALLEWLEARLLERLEGRAHDSRDRLTDILGYLKEALKLLEAWRREPGDPSLARRAVYVVVSVDEAVHEITQELLSFGGAMLAFASRPYDVATLREILVWLERYVGVYLGGIEQLRAEIGERLALLVVPRHKKALSECEEALAQERSLQPRGLRGTTLRPAGEIADAQQPFFRDSGQLARLCAHINRSAQEVLRKMHRHLRELERRSARLHDLRARIGELAVRPPEADPRFAAFTNQLVAASHARFDRQCVAAGARIRPPLPRSHRANSPEAEASRPLRPKQASPESARALRRKREAELAAWLESRVLGRAERVRLSRLVLEGEDLPRRWLDVARAHHLGGGRALEPLGVEIDAHAGRVVLGHDAHGLESPDCEIRRRT